jgi:hypothetical protein
LLALITAEATCFSCLDLKMHSSASSRQLWSNWTLLSNGRTPSQGGNSS